MTRGGILAGVSNTQRAKWTAAEVTAASADRLLGGLWRSVEAEAFRRVISARLARELAAEGAEPGVIAAMEQGCMAAGEDFWADLYAETLGASQLAFASRTPVR